MGGTCNTHRRNAYKMFAGKPQRQRSLGRRKRRWKDHIEINLVEKVCEEVD
jgi:hypothetical protein